MTASIQVFPKSKESFKDTMAIKEAATAWCVVSSLLMLRGAVMRSIK